MTADWVGDNYGTLSANCTGFNGNKKDTAVFPVTSLKRVDK